MLRQTQHARIFINHFELCPLVLSLSKDSERVFQQAWQGLILEWSPCTSW